MVFRQFLKSQQLHNMMTASMFHIRQGFAANHNCLTGVAVALVISVPSLANFSLGTELYGFVLPIDSSLKKDLNIELLRMSENGSLQAITSRWLSSTNSEI